MNQLTISLWGDEAFAAILAQKDIWGIITTAARDTAPPLYYLLLHGWVTIFGASEIGVRTFSILLYFLLGLVVFAFTKEMFGKKSAIFATILIFLNPIIFTYAFEARMYMLLVLLATCSMWFFKTKRWKLYIIAMVGALYTHHFAFFIFATQVLYFCVSNSYLFLTKRKWESKALLSFIIIIVCYIPWIPIFLDQSKRVNESFWLGRPHNIGDLGILYARYLSGSVYLPQSVLVVFTSILLLVTRGFGLKIDGFLYLWAVFPPLITFVWSFFGRPLFFDRYLIISIPAITILLASQTRKFLPLVRNLLIGLTIIGLLSLDFYIFTHPIKGSYKDVANYIHKTYGKNTLVVNYYTEKLNYFELKYQGVNVKIYTTHGLPFWNGTALIEEQDILEKLPEDQQMIVVASGRIREVNIPNYHQVKQQKIQGIYIFQYEKNSIYKQN